MFTHTQTIAVSTHPRTVTSAISDIFHALKRAIKRPPPAIARLSIQTFPLFNREDADEATECFVILTAPRGRVSDDEILFPIVFCQWCGDDPQFSPTNISPTLRIEADGRISGTIDEPILAPAVVQVDDPTKPIGSKTLRLYITAEVTVP